MRRLWIGPLLLLLACKTTAERPFMLVYEGDGIISYDKTPSADFPPQLHFPKLPITISVDEDALDYYDSARLAVEFWNSAIGARIFALTKPPADVEIVLGVFDRPKRLGETRHERWNGELHAVCTIKDAGSYILAYYIIAHELGHALGLAHDKIPNSVMYPIVEARPVFVKDSAKKGLQKIYLGGTK